MMQEKLGRLLNPATIAISGASTKEGSLGQQILQNLVNGNFYGTIYPVNPKYNSIRGIKCYGSMQKVPVEIDLAIITVPPHRVLEVLQECCAKKVGGILVMSPNLAQDDPALESEIAKRCKKNQIPLIGIDSFGFLLPHINLNASLAPRLPRKGGVAFISQSKSITGSILEWADWKPIGFSSFISVGKMLDVSLHHLIDFLGKDPFTRSILIFLESVTEVRRFLSAARAFSRTKPIIVLKAGKSKEGAAIIRQHTDWEPGTYEVYQAAFQRVGIILVETIDQLFDAAEALSTQPRPDGQSLAIITNGGGPGVLATDYLIRQGGQLPRFRQETTDKLVGMADARCLRNGLIDLNHNINPDTYRAVIQCCLEDPDVNGVLVILSPNRNQSRNSFSAIFENLNPVAQKPVLISWMGYGSSDDHPDIFRTLKMPVYRFPESAVDTFLKMAAYTRNTRVMYETPRSIPFEFLPDYDQAFQQVQQVLKREDKVLKASEVAVLFTAYGLPVPKPETEPYRWLHQNGKKYYPLPPIRLGSKWDDLVGPVLFVGAGGEQAEVLDNPGVGIPPLNLALARRMIERSSLGKLLAAHPEEAAAAIEPIELTLYKMSCLLLDFPQVKRIDINPVVVVNEQVIAYEAAVELHQPALKQQGKYSHLVISPYPQEYVKHTQLANGQEITLRPIKPEDEALELAMIKTFSRQSLYYRFFGYINHFTREMITRFTHNDYDREIAIIAEIKEPGRHEMIGVVRLVADADNETAEFAIAIPDAWQHKGLGNMLTDYILNIARMRGIKRIVANVLADNEGMIHIFQKRGFQMKQEDFKTLLAELEL